MSRPTRAIASERGMTLIELAIVVIVMGILLVIALTTVLRARVSANEGSAIAALRTINTAQFQYQATCGNGLYADSFVILSARAPGETEGLLVGDLAVGPTPTRSGYTFAMGDGAGGAVGPADCNGNPTQTRYYVSATPDDGAGTRAFATNHTGTLWQALGAIPPPEPFAAPSHVVE